MKKKNTIIAPLETYKEENEYLLHSTVCQTPEILW